MLGLHMLMPLLSLLTGCDINKDITVTDMLQLSAINIQLKDANRVFRLYIKSFRDKAVYRVEESVKLRSCLVDVLHTIRLQKSRQDQLQRNRMQIHHQWISNHRSTK